MRNLFKKSLAIVVALALCLTALVGAVTVNAETKTGTITADVTVGEATVDVVFTITTDGLNEAIFSYAYDQALGAPTAIASVNDDLEVVTAETGNLFELRDTSQDGLADVTVGKVKFTFDKPADGTYNVTLSVHSAGASGTDEILIDIAPCTATVEIKAACEHTNKTTSEEVTKAATCTEIGYKTVTVTCNDCSEVISVTENVEIPALGHKYNYVNNGDGTHTGTCANDAEHTVTEDHNFVDGTCSACGAVEQTGPVIDEELSFRDVYVAVTSTVDIRYRVYKSVFAKYGEGATIKVIVSGKEYSFANDDTLYNAVDVPETEATNTASTSSTLTFYYYGVPMHSLGLNVKAYIQVYDAEGNYVAKSPEKVDSPELLLKDNLANTQTVEGKTAITELLNMAAAAQKMFAANKAGTDLANAVAEGKLVNNGVDQTNIITEIPTLNNVDSIIWEPGNDEFAAAHKFSTACVLTVAPIPRFYIGGRTTLDKSKIKMVFTYENPSATSTETLTKTIDCSIPEQAELVTTSGARFAFDVPTFEFHNSNQTITATFYYDGVKMATGQYSVESYVSKQLAEGSTASQVAKDMSTAIAKFGLAFRKNKGIA